MNSLVNVAALTVTVVAVILSVASCDQASSFEPGTSYEGSILKLTIEEIERVGQVAYTERPEGGKVLEFTGKDVQDIDVSLAGTSWVLESQTELYGRETKIFYGRNAVRVSIHDQDLLIPGIELSIEFEDGSKLKGNAGCNKYSSGNYSAKGGVFSVGQLNATENDCDSPAGVMEQETQFLELLEAAVSYSVSGDRLQITAPGHVKDYVIQPSSEGNELVVIRIRLENNASIDAQLDLDDLPAELRMDTGRYHSVDINDARMAVEGFHSDLNEFVPLIRDFHFLQEGSELEGWLIFDVPKDSVAESLKWEAGGDIIIIDFE